MIELKAETIVSQGSVITLQMYPKAEVDKIILDKDAEIRKLRRALYKACANWASAKVEYEQFDSNMFMCGFVTDKEISWKSMMEKCLKKTEEFK